MPRVGLGTSKLVEKQIADGVSPQLRHEELAREEEVRAGNLRGPDGAADGGLVAVHPRAVEVPRACFYSVGYLLFY